MSLFVAEDDEEYNDQPLSTSLNGLDYRGIGPRVKDIEEIDPDHQSEEIDRDHQPEENHSQPINNHESSSGLLDNTIEVCCNLPLKFQKIIVEDMLSKDGLLILGRGLGWEPLVANMLHVLSTPVGNKKSLLVILNASEEENLKISEELNELSWIEYGNSLQLREPVPFHIISNEMSTADKRARIYDQGGVVSLTSRILVVDMLSGVLEPLDITGVFVLHAERVTEKLNECFIVNLYRDGNEWGFIKAITDEPEQFFGFTPLQSKLKYLRLSNVLLWPRFHVEVLSSLTLQDKNLLKRKRQEQEKRRFVTEISVKLTYKMSKIQNAILACTQACVGELKRHNPTIANEYWTIDNVHDTNFVQRIRLSLEPLWHQISWTSKQLVNDLSTMKELMHALVSVDSLEFYQLVQGILMSNIRSETPGLTNNVMSPWLNLDEATTIISYARERALAKVKTTKKHEDDSIVEQEEYLLEALPKWDQLGQILDDIMYEKQYTGDENPIIIMCSSSKTISQLREFITTMRKEDNVAGKTRFSSRGMMLSRLHTYLAWKNLTSLTKKLSIELEEKDKDADAEETPEQLNQSKTFTRGKGYNESKRRRTRGAAAVANVFKLHAGAAEGKSMEAVDLDPSILKNAEEEQGVVDESAGGFIADDDDLEVIDETEFVEKFELRHIDKSNQIIIEKYNNVTNNTILQELHPSYIIMYEPDLAFIRRVEVYQAINKEDPARVFFMYYSNSLEEQKHLLNIKKEKEAFTSLIREKATLGKHFETNEESFKFRIRKNEVVNTRIAGGAKFGRDELKIITDVREFRSALPNLLYRIGIKVIPCMITVGDYVISPRICVERKAIPDLISSFKSGRLYNQCEQMFRNYELPVLLIEFDENKSFLFDPTGRVFSRNTSSATKAAQSELQSKIMMLLVAFPKLKIIWSSSPYETAQIFLTLKANEDEPDVAQAISKGLYNTNIVSESENAQGSRPLAYNDDSIDLIKNIPGINENNYHQIISRVENIQSLVGTSLESLEEWLGQENGRKVYGFLHRKIT